MKKYKVFEMLKRSQNLKYRLAINSLIVGILVGLTIVAHRIIISKLSPIFLNIYKNGRHNFIIVPLIFLTLIALGYIVGKCLKKQPMISGSGIPQVEGILTRNLKMNWFSVLFYKFVGGLICLCAGLSVGREGPSVQMGACIGEGVSKYLKNLDNEEKYLITSGASAGLSAAFNAPLSGVMFALEEIHKNFNVSVLISVMCASVTGDFISRNVFGLSPAFHFVVEETLPLQYYGMILLLGILCGIGGVLYNKSTMKVQQLFSNSRFSAYGVIVPLLVAGVLALVLPDVLGSGHRMIEMLSNNHTFVIQTLLMLLVCKFAFSLISFGSGAPGGIFFPLLVLGSFVGAIFGSIAIQMFDFPDMYLSNFIIMAMAGTFAAIVRAPITGIILIAEMSGTLTHLLPLALVSLVAYLCASLLNCEPIYESLLHNLLVKNGVDLSAFGGEKHIVQVVVELGSPVCDQAIKDIKWPSKCLIISIDRQGKEIIPRGNTILHTGDTLIALLNDEDAPYIQHELEKCCTHNWD